MVNIKWQVSKEAVASKIDDEVILMSVDQDAYFGIDPVGSRIWELLSQQPATVDELVNLLTEEYEVEYDDCKQDVLSFINELAERKLIFQID